MDKKTLFAVGGTVLAGILITAIYTTLLRGVEEQFGDNPAFTDIHIELKAIREEVKSLSLQVTANNLKSSTTDARIEGRLELVVTQSNAILAAHQ